MSSQFITYHADGLQTVTSSSVQGGSKHHKRQLTEEELEKKCENDLFWNDRKREREEWS